MLHHPDSINHHHSLLRNLQQFFRMILSSAVTVDLPKADVHDTKKHVSTFGFEHW